MQVGLLRAGGLLQRRLRRHLQGVQPHRAPSGPARQLPAGTAPTPATQCTDMGSTNPCGTDGRCNGAGACRNYAAGHRRAAPRAAPDRRCRRRGHATAPGVCRAATTSPCTPYTCGTAAPAGRPAPPRPECTTGNTCVNRAAARFPIGGACPSGVNSRLRVRVLRQQRLLQQRLHGHVHVVLADGQRRDVFADRARRAAAGGRRSARRPRRRRAATTGPVTAPGRAASTSAARSALRRCARARRALSARSCATAPGSAAPRRRARAERTPATRRRAPAGPAARPPPPTAWRPTSATPTSARSSRPARRARRPASATPASARRDSAATRRVHRHVQVVRDRRQPRHVHATSPTAPRPRPRASASATAATSCGLDGMCNGAGACRFWASGTQCAAGTCVGSTLTPAAHLRRRRRLPVRDEHAVRSVPVRLGDRVQDDLHQRRGGLRVAEQLREHELRQAAERRGLHGGGECNSNFCAQGVCCSTACTGTCASCALAGSLGTCSSVPAGQDPLNQCTDQGVAMCGTDGSCNGSGACRRYASGVTCVAGDLPDDVDASRRTSTCNASGTCVTPATHAVRAVRLQRGRVQDHLRERTPTASGPPYVCIGHDVRLRDERHRPARGARAVADQSGRHAGLQAVQQRDDADSAVGADAALLVHHDDTAHRADGVGATSPRHWRRANITLTFAAVSPARTNADYYFQVGFARGGRKPRRRARTRGNIQTALPQERLQQLQRDQRLLVQRVDRVHVDDQGDRRTASACWSTAPSRSGEADGASAGRIGGAALR